MKTFLEGLASGVVLSVITYLLVTKPMLRTKLKDAMASGVHDAEELAKKL